MSEFPQKNYTLGRGQFFFDPFLVGTTTKTGQLYLGNTPDAKLSSTSTALDHFDADNGIKEKDDSVDLELTRTGTFTTDHVSPGNLARFFLGSDAQVSQSAVTALTDSFAEVVLGARYQLGITGGTPAGLRGINPSTFVLKVLTVTKTAGTDYTLDADTGGVTILKTGTIAAGDTVLITNMDTIATTYDRVVTAASAQIYGALFYRSNNPKGKQFDYYWPYVSLKPDGDFTLKSDDWQKIGFTFEALKLDDNTQACYISGRPGA